MYASIISSCNIANIFTIFRPPPRQQHTGQLWGFKEFAGRRRIWQLFQTINWFPYLFQIINMTIENQASVMLVWSVLATTCQLKLRAHSFNGISRHFHYKMLDKSGHISFQVLCKCVRKGAVWPEMLICLGGMGGGAEAKCLRIISELLPTWKCYLNITKDWENKSCTCR